MIVREARAMDVVGFVKVHLPARYEGVAVEEDGKVIALGLIIIGERKRPWVSLDMLPEMREKKATLHRVGKRLVDAGVKAFGEVFVMRDPEEPGAKEWLERLGFVDTGEIYRGDAVMRAGGN